MRIFIVRRSVIGIAGNEFASLICRLASFLIVSWATTEVASGFWHSPTSQRIHFWISPRWRLWTVYERRRRYDIWRIDVSMMQRQYVLSRRKNESLIVVNAATLHDIHLCYVWVSVEIASVTQFSSTTTLSGVFVTVTCCLRLHITHPLPTPVNKKWWGLATLTAIPITHKFRVRHQCAPNISHRTCLRAHTHAVCLILLVL